MHVSFTHHSPRVTDGNVNTRVLISSAAKACAPVAQEVGIGVLIISLYSPSKAAVEARAKSANQQPALTRKIRPNS